ncbi:MAG: hypothetical protein GIX03_05620 [Candidatus Eremiobacteraeota bacterium]|nr:hypothetical protein [Candidatus Eremiobacteraeota bacterium]MBC5802476.1 hypothetical protein [Candidatus Eremiobacteraeota bacterium]MBC5822545.1 hypothetical protein [Candidatus Eremiobacteraeota bacterium]
MMRRAGKTDLGSYLRAFPLLVRHPQIALAPFVAGVAQALLFRVLPGNGGGSGFLGSANSSIAGLAAQLIGFFGFAVALIVADTAWRRERAPFDDAWEEARRKAGDILMAAIGFGFVVYIAGLLGSFIPLAGPLVLGLLALFFFIYTLPAAAVGGVPGGAALQISVERARAAPLPTALVTAIYIAGILYIPAVVVGAVQAPLLSGNLPAPDIIAILVSAAVRAVCSGYVALVLAKTYADLSYGRSSARW